MEQDQFLIADMYHLQLRKKANLTNLNEETLRSTFLIPFALIQQSYSEEVPQRIEMSTHSHCNSNYIQECVNARPTVSFNKLEEQLFCTIS